MRCPARVQGGMLGVVQGKTHHNPVGIQTQVQCRRRSTTPAGPHLLPTCGQSWLRNTSSGWRRRSRRCTSSSRTWYALRMLPALYGGRSKWPCRRQAQGVGPGRQVGQMLADATPGAAQVAAARTPSGASTCQGRVLLPAHGRSSGPP